MASSPKYKCYDSQGKYQASVKDLTLAAAIMVILGNNSTVRLGHTTIIYREGQNGDSSDSYDAVNSFVFDN